MRLAATIAVRLEGPERPSIGSEVKFHMLDGRVLAKTEAGDFGSAFDSGCESLLRREKTKKCVVGSVGLNSTEIGVYVSLEPASLSNMLFGSNGSLTLSGDMIIFKDHEKSAEISKKVYGVKAALASGQELQSRVTVSRMLPVGAFAFALKKSKGGEKFVTIEGNDFCWAVEINGDQTNDAMSFIANVNDMAKKEPERYFAQMDGLADKDELLHIAAFPIDEDSDTVLGSLDKVATHASDSALLEMQKCEYEIVSTQVVPTGSSLRLFVTYMAN